MRCAVTSHSLSISLYIIGTPPTPLFRGVLEAPPHPRARNKEVTTPPQGARVE